MGMKDLRHACCEDPNCKKAFGTETPGEVYWTGTILGSSGTATGTRLKIYSAQHPEPMMFCNIGCALETLKVMEKNTAVWIDNAQGHAEEEYGDWAFVKEGRVDWVDELSDTHRKEYAPMPSHPDPALRNIPLIHTRVENRTKVLCEPDEEWLEQRKERAAEEAITPMRRINGSFPEDEMARAYQPMMKDREIALDRWFKAQEA